MRATILDLRYHMKEILRALDRNETVEILYHGKQKGMLIPVTRSQPRATQHHPYFGMLSSKKSVTKQMKKLRGNRYK